MKLVVEPLRGLVDDPPRVLVSDLPHLDSPSLRLTVTGVDAAGHAWQSVGDYPVTAEGTVRLDDPDRPWWAMQFADRRGAPVAFSAPDTSWRCIVTAEYGGELARQTVQRDYAATGEPTHLAGEGWRLRVYRPPRMAAAPAVLVVPGSTGVTAMAPVAALLASHGYAAAVLGYMQDPGLPLNFERIPVEVVAGGLAALAALPGVDPDRIAVWAVSVGTGLALSGMVGLDSPAVQGIVAISPTSVVWQAQGGGGRPPRVSSLTRNGVDVPWLPMHGERLFGQMMMNALRGRLSRARHSTALVLLPAYTPALQEETAEDAAIPVEEIAAPMLLVAGESDAMWPSATMATSLVERRQRHGRTEDRLLLLPGAGHFIRPPATPTTVDRSEDLVFGGTAEAIAHGQRQAWDATLGFLADRIGPPNR